MPASNTGAVYHAVPNPRGQGRIELRNFCLVAVQLGLVLLALSQFRIEVNYGFQQLIPLIFIGFIGHSYLPLRLRHLC